MNSTIRIPSRKPQRRLRAALVITCRARGFDSDPAAFDNQEIKDRAQDGWQKLKTEVGEFLRRNFLDN